MVKKMLLSTFIFTMVIGNIFLWGNVIGKYKSFNSDSPLSETSKTEQPTEVLANKKDILESTDKLNEPDKEQLNNDEVITRYLKEMHAIDKQFTILIDKSSKLSSTVGDGKLSSLGYEHYMWKEILPEMDIITGKIAGITPPTELQNIHESYIDATNYYHQALLESIPSIKYGDESKLSRYLELNSKGDKSYRDFSNKIIPVVKEYNFEAGAPPDLSQYQYTFKEPYNPNPQNPPNINIEVIHEIFVEQYPQVQSRGGSWGLPPGIEVKR